MIKNTFQLICYCIGLAILLASPIAFASSDDTSNNTVEQLLQRRSKEILDPLIPGARYTLGISVTLKPESNKPTQSKSIYLRSKSTSTLINPTELTASTIKDFTTKVELSLGLPPQFSKNDQKDLEKVLRSSLGLRTSDPIAFTKIKLLRPQEDTKDTQLLRTEAELRDQRKLLEDLKRERDDVKHEAQLAKSNLEKLSLENTQLKTKSVELPKTEPVTLATTFMTKAADLVGYGGIFIAMLFLGLSIRQIAKNIGSSIQSLGSSMQTAAGSLANAQMNTASEVSLTSQPLAKTSDTELPPLPGTPLLAGASSERISAVKKEVSDLMVGANINIIQRYLVDHLSGPATIAKSMIAFEMMGPSQAGKLFESMSPEDKAKIVDFIRSGSYPKQKWELMLQVGEELKTRVALENLTVPEAPETQQLHQQMKRLTKEDQLTVLQGVSTDCYPRVLSFLDAPAMSNLLGYLVQSSPSVYEKCTDALLKLPEALFAGTHAKQFDATILTAVNQLKRGTRIEAFKPLLKHYEDIISALPDDQGATLMQEFSKEPELAKHLQASIVTISTLFKLAQNQIYELTASLNIKDLAALAYGIKDSDRNVLFQIIDKVRLDLLKEELGRYEAGSKMRAERDFKNVKAHLVQTLKTLKSNDELQFESENNQAQDTSTTTKSAA